MDSRQVSDMEKMEAEAKIEDATDVKSGDAIMYVGLKNDRGKTLKLYATKSWVGGFKQQPAGSVDVGQTCQFSHAGSKAAVIYGEEQGSTNPAGYLLVWDEPNSLALKKVLVECGPLSDVYTDGWESRAFDSIQFGGEEITCLDPITSSKAHASIRNESGAFIMYVASVNFA